MAQKVSWKTYLVLIFCVTTWGSNFVFGAILVGVFNPGLIAFTRLIFILIFLYFMAYKKIKVEKLTLKSYMWLALAGFIGISINQWSFYASLGHTDPITAALILALSPIVTAILSKYYFRERKSLNFWFGMLIGISGVWLVITKGTFYIPIVGKGEALIFLTMLTFSVFLLFVQQLSKAIHPITITWYTNLFGFFGLFPFIKWSELDSMMAVPAKYWLLLAATAVIMHGLCTMLWNNSIQQVGASRAALLLNLEPFIAMITSWLVLSNNVTSFQLLGGVIIVIGVTTSLKVKKDPYKPSHLNQFL